MATANDLDLIQQLTEDHRVLRVMFSELSGLPIGDPQRKDVADRAGVALVKHLAAEETHLYPIARQGRPPGDATVDEALDGHAALQALVREVGVREADNPRFDRLLAQLVETATEHFGVEESRIFPVVGGDTPDLELEALGGQARVTEDAASPIPTRQPPTALPADKLPPPERGIGERIRDVFRSGPDQ